jgi:hypothetical protein
MGVTNVDKCKVPEPAKGKPEEKFKKVTFRKGSGKAHRGLLYPNGYLLASCSCPGSANGSLTRGAVIICEGHEKSNCGN